jgi:alpha-D-ribose 1-methylphosphonate 5-triphosphate diphosphatase PhnM
MKEAGDGGGGSRARAASKGRQRLMGACNKSRGGGHEHAQKARGDVARGRTQDLIFLPTKNENTGVSLLFQIWCAGAAVIVDCMNR